jgi:TRAP-type uncharacterized transport system substrate-binding protein
MMLPPNFARPVVTRSAIVLEMASVLARDNRWPLQRATVTMQPQGGGVPGVVLFGSDSYQSIAQVASGQVQLAIVNPAGPLTMAYRGAGPFKEAVPVRNVAVIPSHDAFVFAVHERTGLTSLEELRDRRYPLRVSLRGQRDHSNHFVTEQALGALGFSLADIESWGGQVRYDPGLPSGISTSGPDTTVSRLERVRRGEADAIFDEGIRSWLPQALDQGMRALPLTETLVGKLEAMGLRRHVIRKSRYPKLPQDLLTLDFSGWPIFTNANVPDEVITSFCAALDACKDRVPLEDMASLPLERMCKDSPEAPLDVPLHPAAERYWRRRGYL